MTSTVIEKTWVAYGPAGVVGSVHRLDGGGYTFRLLSDESPRADYPSLDVAKRALHASLVPGAEWPEFLEH
ncbi:MAG: methyltransferase [Actinomycetota bacterium]